MHQALGFHSSCCGIKCLAVVNDVSEYRLTPNSAAYFRFYNPESYRFVDPAYIVHGKHAEAAHFSELSAKPYLASEFRSTKSGMIHMCFVLYDDVVPDGYEPVTSNEIGQLCVKVIDNVN